MTDHIPHLCHLCTGPLTGDKRCPKCGTQMYNIDLSNRDTALLVADGMLAQLPDRTYVLTEKGAKWFHEYLDKMLDGKV